MLADLHFGNYANTVIQLQKRVKALVKPDDKLKVVVVGHGGRDCWISLLLVRVREGIHDASVRERRSLAIKKYSSRKCKICSNRVPIIESLCFYRLDTRLWLLAAVAQRL